MKTALERAFELAESGVVRSTSDIRVALKKEGYNEHQVQGQALSRQLTGLMKKARETAPDGSSQP